MFGGIASAARTFVVTRAGRELNALAIDAIVIGTTVDTAVVGNFALYTDT
jgi:hypothetical protein